MTKKEKIVQILKEGRVELFNRWRKIFDIDEIDLMQADLYGADLSGVNLRGVDLYGADLSGVNLRGVDIRWANLEEANLSGADLRQANLYRANLYRANLSGADLRQANLEEANLSGADLKYVNTNNTTSYFNLQCPEEGSFVGWKKCRNNTIVKLLITEDAKRSSATTRKCRCSKAKVLEIFDREGNEINEATSKNDYSFKYIKGEIVEVDEFDENRWNECSTGIHFFITKKEAEKY